MEKDKTHKKKSRLHSAYVKEETRGGRRQEEERRRRKDGEMKERYAGEKGDGFVLITSRGKGGSRGFSSLGYRFGSDTVFTYQIKLVRSVLANQRVQRSKCLIGDGWSSEAANTASETNSLLTSCLYFFQRIF